MIYYLKNWDETKYTRNLEFRIDSYGIYLLAYDWVDDVFWEAGHDLVAGISYQWPLWLMKILNKENNNFPPSTNCFSYYVFS